VTSRKSRKPFAQLPFAEVPEAPRVAHPFLALPERELEMESRPFGRMRVRYRELGDGEPLLLVHGLMTSSYSWRYVIEPLSARWRVIVPDLPGAGRSDKPDASYALDALGAWIGEFQSAVGARGCAVVGNSLGGLLCMRLALDDPGAMSALLNVHSPAFPDARLRALHFGLSVSGSYAVLSWMIRRDLLRWAHGNVHYRDETLKSLEEARVYAEPLASEEGRRAFARWLHESLAPSGLSRFVADLRARGFPVPLRLVYAREDPMVPPSVGPRLAALVPDAELVWLEDASHFAQVDQPAALVREIHRFFAG
jgi:pimeloyl-ACP methyl ester carboxylesterase